MDVALREVMPAVVTKVCRRVGPVGAVLALPLLVGARAAEPPAPTPVPRFHEAVEVRVANVDVFVTDRSGNPVTDLTRDDFVLLEEGTERPITNFLAVDAATQSDTEEVAAAAPPSSLSGQQAAIARTALPLRLVIFVDAFNLHVFNRRRVFADLERFLRERPEGVKEVAVAVFDGTLAMRQPFTADMGRVEAALARLDEESTPGVAHIVAKKLALEDIRDSQTEEQALAKARGYAAEVLSQTRRTIAALKVLAAGMAGADGRTAVVYVSDGFQLRAAEDVFARVAGQFRSAAAQTEALSFDGSAWLTELATVANASGVTFYTIGATGLEPPAGVAAEHASPYGGPGTRSSIASLSGRGSTMYDQMERYSYREPLETLAADTGGTATINHNSVLGDLERMAEDFTSYYSIGFEPAAPADGRVRRIEVRVKRPGLRVRYRRSLRLKSAAEKLADGAVAALYGVQDANPLDFKVAVAPRPHERSGSSVLVPVRFLLPASRLALVPRGTLMVGRVDLAAVAQDGKGRLSPVVEVRRDIRVEPDAVSRGDYCVLAVTLTLRPGHNDVALAVRDEVGDTRSFALVAVDASADASE